MATQAEKRRQTGNLKMQCLQVNISDRYTCATNGFYSALFGPGHVGNRDTKVFIYSCNIPHFTMRRTQAKKPHINCRKGLRY
jgi:hypothetical protein